ncbi:MAG: response regulator [Devosiaceae bacterium]|nr:response regulator [Devosiaceae bacterium MH13]
MPQPIIDNRQTSPVRRNRPLIVVLVLGLLLALVFLLAFTRYGASPVALLTVLAGFSAIGVAALLALVLGFVQIAGRGAPTPTWADRFLDDEPDAVLCTDGNGQIMYANAAYGEMTGADNADLVRLPDRVFGTEAAAADTVYQLLKQVAGGAAGDAEVRLSRGAAGEGDARWYQIAARPLPLADPDGLSRAGESASHGTVWRIRDVTTERERQEQLFKDLQQAVDYLDHAPAGFFSCDHAGAIDYMNATLASWLGYDLADLDQLGLNLGDMLAGDGASLLASAPTTTDYDGLATIVDVDLLRRNGSRMPVRIHHRVPMSADGKPRASRTLVINRSTGFDADESVRAAEVKFARFFHNAPLAIAVIGKDGELAQRNAPFASLFPDKEQANGVLVRSPGRFVDLFSADTAEAVQRAMDDALAQRGRIRPVDVVIGEPAPAEGAGQASIADVQTQTSAQLFLSAASDEDDSQVLAFLIDTSEQKALEQQFAQTQKMMAFGQLAGGVAHDFNNMLQAIMGNVDLLMLNMPPSDPSYRYITPIRQNCNRAAALVRHLLAFSRKQTLRPQRLRVDEVLSDLSMTIDRLVGEKVKLEVDIGGDVWPVMADLSQLENVLINLAVNARDAMPDGGTLTMSTRNVMREECGAFDFKGLEPADYVLVSISDTGTGIPPEIMEKIFEPFFTTKGVGEGTGLGLATVYGTIKQTGGYVYPESTVGEGTTFHILLPRQTGSAQDEAGEVEAEAPAASQEDLTGVASVLLVEDDEGVRMVNATLLRSGGYTVFEADSGVEALEVLDEEGDAISLIVSDVVMPEMDGPTLLQEVRQRYPEMRFIFVSGYAEDAFEKNLPKDQEFTFLAKPFTMKDFAETVKRVLTQ